MNRLLRSLAIAVLFAPPALADEVALAPKKNFSTLESAYSARADQKLEQFGYDLFGVPGRETQKRLDSLANAGTGMEPAQDEFVLHAGDELEIVLVGQRNVRGLYKIDEHGLLVVPRMPPIPAQGRTIGQVRLSVMAAARNLHNTDATLSLSSVREIGVLVAGNVRRPGRPQGLTVFHTVIDALVQVGGVTTEGSLRRIKLVRDGGTNTIDLYALLVHGAGMDLHLRDGDRIIVPPIGPTLGIAGGVERPGIYELPEHGIKIALTEALELGGGLVAPDHNRFLSLDGNERTTEIHDPARTFLGDGSILMVAKKPPPETLGMAAHMFPESLP